MSDLRSAAEVLDRMRAAEEELIPSSVIHRLLDGDPPLAVWREDRNISQTDLARQSGVNRIQIISIEAGRKTGSVITLRKMAAALKIEIEDLINDSL